MKNAYELADLVARMFLALLFLFEGMDGIVYFESNVHLMIEYGWTFYPDFFLILSNIILLTGGFSVLVGYRSTLGALLLLLYWIPYTFFVHSWWNDVEAVARVERILFMKNIAIAGGLILVIIYGSGRYSIKSLFANTKVPRKYR